MSGFYRCPECWFNFTPTGNELIVYTCPGEGREFLPEPLCLDCSDRLEQSYIEAGECSAAV